MRIKFTKAELLSSEILLKKESLVRSEQFAHLKHLPCLGVIAEIDNTDREMLCLASVEARELTTFIISELPTELTETQIEEICAKLKAYLKTRGDKKYPKSRQVEPPRLSMSKYK